MILVRNKCMNNKIICIVGMSRSGTTLMARVLARSRSTYVLRETHLFREFGAILSGDLDRCLTESEVRKVATVFAATQKHSYYARNRPVDLIEEYPDFEQDLPLISSPRKIIEYLLFSKANERVVVEQTPNHVHYLDLISHIFSDVKILNMVRDPRAVVCSQKKKWKATSRLEGAPTFEVLRSWCNYHPFTQAVLWRKSFDSAQSFVGCDSSNRKLVMSVRFEQLVARPAEMINEICEFCSIPYEEDMLDISLSASSNIKGSQAGFVADVVDKWREGLGTAECWIIERVAGRRIYELGLERSVKFIPFFGVLGWGVTLPFQLMIASILNFKRLKGGLLLSLKCRIAKLLHLG